MNDGDTDEKAAGLLPFFVYGTLLPGQPNAHLWQGKVERQVAARLGAACLHDMGHYPMCVPVAEGSVIGVALWIRPSFYTEVVQALDFLEGYDPQQPQAGAYRRVETRVALANGRLQPAWVYMGDVRLVQDKPIVPAGDWASYAAAHKTDTIDWWTAVHTVAGRHEEE